jgi:hypothetical protein
MDCLTLSSVSRVAQAQQVPHVMIVLALEAIVVVRERQIIPCFILIVMVLVLAHVQDVAITVVI